MYINFENVNKYSVNTNEEYGTRTKINKTVMSSQTTQPHAESVCASGVLYQKQVSRVETSNYIPQYMWDIITCPCPWYLLLTQHPWYLWDLLYSIIKGSIMIVCVMTVLYRRGARQHPRQFDTYNTHSHDWSRLITWCHQICSVD